MKLVLSVRKILKILKNKKNRSDTKNYFYTNFFRPIIGMEIWPISFATILPLSYFSHLGLNGRVYREYSPYNFIYNSSHTQLTFCEVGYGAATLSSRQYMEVGEFFFIYIYCLKSGFIYN